MISHPIVMDLSLSEAGRSALARAAATVGAQAGMTVDQLADLGVVVDAIVAGMRTTGGSRACVVLAAAPGRIDLRVGPLARDGAAVLRAECDVPGLGPVLDRLADVRTDQALDGDYLVLGIGGPPPAAA
jgi:hypothetical protein